MATVIVYHTFKACEEVNSCDEVEFCASNEVVRDLEKWKITSLFLY